MDHELRMVVKTSSDLQATGTLERIIQACTETGAVVSEALFDPPIGATADVSGQRPPEDTPSPAMPAPQLTEERLKGESEADFSQRMARIQQERLEAKREQGAERDPLAPLKHVFGS
jgi:hypothetical protein